MTEVLMFYAYRYFRCGQFAAHHEGNATFAFLVMSLLSTLVTNSEVTVKKKLIFYVTKQLHEAEFFLRS
jgi:hypothetical protein